jgi:hypothetical protein
MHDDMRERRNAIHHKVLVALQHARNGLRDRADARLLEQRVEELRREVDTAGYSPNERRRLTAFCEDAIAQTRWLREAHSDQRQ